MQDDIAIKVKNVTKVYHLYDKPQDRFKEALHPFRKSYHHDFFATNDISFEIKKGETVGIIGKNGAGKSTLLKMITGVLTPTSGDIQVNGKIASLLELGAGFNPEMTGLENIYLNGTLMGFSHQEMEPKIEAILEFADIGEFISQPVKVYSSGMFARLAFSVAINVEPDILIVDEALSVGDARFQSKCIRKMEELAKKGITILVVTHDMQSVNKFCKEVIWLQDGKISQLGEPAKIIENYVSFMTYGLETEREMSQENKKKTNQKTKELKLIDTRDLDSFGEKKAIITGAVFVDKNGNPTSLLKQGDYVSFICKFSTSIELHDVGIGVLFKDRLNNDILTFNSYMYGAPILSIKEGSTTTVTIKFKVPKLFPREYVIAVALSEGTQQNHIQQHWLHALTTVNILSKDHIDGSLLSLYPDEIEYSYE
ncbi:MAG: ABC transporter ATP-binding protein [Flavobacteriales bacterium]|jgi:teichoic acid transport system ATP-binding protein|nr:ABC transporter ATP-binding protein [Flavobacteriales bacterium]